jgi:hypothetical protein
VLDSASAVYSALVWRREADDLVVLRAKADQKREGATHIALAWTSVAANTIARAFDPAAHPGFPAGMRTVSFRRPSWSDDGKIVFLGIAKWDEKAPPPPKKETTNGDAADAAEETAGVDVWHSRDVDVMPKQKIGARTDRQRNLLSAWHVADGRFVQLAKELTEQVTPIKRTQLAYAANWNGYAMDRTIGRPAADLHLVDMTTGERTRVKDRVEDGYVQASPGGRRLLFFQADHYWTIDTKSRTVTNITKAVPAS